MPEVDQWMVEDLTFEDGLPSYHLTKIRVDVDPDWSSIADELAAALAAVQTYWGVDDYFLTLDADFAADAAKQALERYKEARGHGPR